jgi:hypothetical protein
MIKTYWDLSERERAALSREDVARYLDAELMMKGVLALAPLTLVPEPAPKLETKSYYRVAASDYDVIDLAFASEDDARAFVSLRPLRVRSDWQLGSENRFVEPLGAGTIRTEDLPGHAEVEAAKATLKEAKAAKEENDRRRRIHEEQSKAVESAVSGLWEDWHECRAKAERMARVSETFAKYTALASGDLAVASKFLRQVFSVEELVAAEEWTGVRMDVPRAGAVQ